MDAPSPASPLEIAIPRLPVFGWGAWRGRRNAATSCMLDRPLMQFTTSGRASILLALEALEVRAGDRVLLPTYHCLTMVSPAVARGAEPVFYPLTESGAADLEWLDSFDMTGTRAILVPHYFGLPQPMASIRRWCDAHGVALIEDCAHALFGRSGDRAIGEWGDMAIGSLTKFLPVPEGGCLVANGHTRALSLSPCTSLQRWKAALDVAEEGARYGRLQGLNALLMGGLGALRGLRRRGNPSQGTVERSNFSRVGDDSVDEGTSIDTTLAHRQLTPACRWLARYLPRERIVLRRRARYLQLAQRLSGVAGMRPLQPLLPEDCAPYVFPLWVDRPDPGYAALRALGIPVFRWDRLWTGTPRIAGDHGLQWSHHVLQLACHQDFSDGEFERYISALLGQYADKAKSGPDAPRTSCAP